MFSCQGTDRGCVLSPQRKRRVNIHPSTADTVWNMAFEETVPLWWRVFVDGKVHWSAVWLWKPAEERLQAGFRGDLVPSGCELYHWFICRYHFHCPWATFPRVWMSKVHRLCMHWHVRKYRIFTCCGGEGQGELITALLTPTRIWGHISGSPYPQQLLSTVWIMTIYDLAGSSYDAKKQIKSTLGGGGSTYDTRANFLPAFSQVLCESSRKAEGSPLPSPHPWFVSQERLISHASPRPKFCFRNCDKSRECARRVWWGAARGLHHSHMPPKCNVLIELASGSFSRAFPNGIRFEPLGTRMKIHSCC